MICGIVIPKEKHFCEIREQQPLMVASGCIVKGLKK